MEKLFHLFRRRRNAGPEYIRAVRFQALLTAASKTCYYRPLLETATLSQTGVAWASVEEALGRLPRLDAQAVRGRPGAFWNHRPRGEGRHRLYCPLPNRGWTAILMRGFHEDSRTRVFPRYDRAEIIAFRPDTIAAPVSLLRRLAEPAEDRGVRVPRLSRAVIAFTVPLEAFLSEEARDLMWRVFQVPVFGQIAGLDGELLAWECEAHEGLHIHEDNAVFEMETAGGEPELLLTSLVNLRMPLLRLGTGLTGRMEHEVCGCGRPGWKLLGLRRRTMERREPSTGAMAAAYAAG